VADKSLVLAKDGSLSSSPPVCDGPAWSRVDFAIATVATSPAVPLAWDHCPAVSGVFVGTVFWVSTALRAQAGTRGGPWPWLNSAREGRALTGSDGLCDLR
jgi:hypothetical protein